MAEVEKKTENLVYAKPKLITDNVMHYCPGCSHGTVHKLIAEVIEEMGLAEKTVGISPVGCSVFAYNYIDIDWIEAAHGRALAVATAVKRLYPQNMVFTYQGDGDLSPSVRRSRSMRRRAARTSWPSTSTMRSTA